MLKTLIITICLLCSALIAQSQVIIPSQSKNLEASELLPEEIDGNWGYVNKSGAIIIKPQFVSVGIFSEGLAAAQLQVGGKLGFINERGEVVIAPRFDSALNFFRGMAAVRIGDHIEGK